MKHKYKFLFILLLIKAVNVYSDPILEWASIYGPYASGLDYGYCIAADDSGNVYSAGQTTENTTAKYILIKYNSTGQTMWIRTYTSVSNYDYITAIALDNIGNVYVSGLLDYTFGTIKYNSAGTLQWVQTFALAGTLPPSAIAVENSGNIYVTGHNYTVKYNSSGALLWYRLFGPPSNLWTPIGAKIAIEPRSDNVYVTGENNGHFLTVKYNSFGAVLWSQAYAGPANGDDFALSIALDKAANVYVTGYSAGIGTNEDYATIKYNASGTQQWVRRFDDAGDNSNQHPIGLALDSLGNVYVSGYSESYSDDIVTIKYTPAGTEQWINRYSAVNNLSIEPRDITSDSHGKIYICGYKESANGKNDVLTIKYDQNGTVWSALYGPLNTDEGAYAITTDSHDNIYLTGYTTQVSRSGGAENSITIKYSQSGAMEKGNNFLNDVREESPAKISLNQNFPNPFNPVTQISFSISTSGDVKLTVYDELGREISTLVNENLNAGSHSISFDGSNLASGIYFYRLDADGNTDIKKMMLVK